jgi:hypothetical protein
LERRVDFRIGDFRELQRLLEAGETADVAVSAYALHHLDARAKTEVVHQAVEVMTGGAWFLNADLVATGRQATAASRASPRRVASLTNYRLKRVINRSRSGRTSRSWSVPVSGTPVYCGWSTERR